ncbi:MAG: hypothetical protein F6K41_15255 [Symploca sp. SIO3E6]|nr:hypothetical protein [Caldora sp. SIO3E6]
MGRQGGQGWGAEERRSRGAEEQRSRGAEEEERTDNFWILSWEVPPKISFTRTRGTRRTRETRGQRE